jgi:hypothetical protein
MLLLYSAEILLQTSKIFTEYAGKLECEQNFGYLFQRRGMLAKPGGDLLRIWTRPMYGFYPFHPEKLFLASQCFQKQ